ncbi:VOC family protein [Salinifilum ghardaiensis]
MPNRIAVLAIDAADPRAVADFWCQVLDWRIVEESAEGVIGVAPLNGAWPHIDVAPVPEHEAGKNRLRFDLRADGVATADELERLIGLGAQHAHRLRW